MQATPSARIALFVRKLRAEGFHIGVGETMDALRIAGLCKPLDAADLRAGLRALVCQDVVQWHRFDKLFQDFWYPAQQAMPENISAAEAIDPRLLAGRAQRGGVTGLAHAMDPANDAYSASLQGFGAGASRQNTLSRADFRFLTERRDQRDLELLAERVALRIRRRITRNRRENARDGQIAMRRTLRRSLAVGGMPIYPRYLQRVREPPKLIWLQDVSHSMASYSPLLTRFGRGLLRAFPDAEAFVFHVKLFQVTSLYREVNVESLRQRLQSRNELWLGGTRIAESLAQFNRQFASRVMDSRSIVIVLSDGLDSDSPELLLNELMRLRARAHRLLWLNPMLDRDDLASAEVSPQLRQLIDYLGPAHNLESLVHAAEYLIEPHTLQSSRQRPMQASLVSTA